jgi:uncharacterized protein
MLLRRSAEPRTGLVPARAKNLAQVAVARPFLLLLGSNVFMTTAWYWHQRFKDMSLVYVILISWGLAFIEYCLAVPANRYGNSVYNPAQLPGSDHLGRVRRLLFVYLREPITLSQGFGFVLIAAGAFFVFHKW